MSTIAIPSAPAGTTMGSEVTTSVPAVLRAADRWVVWRYESVTNHKTSEVRRTKVPYCASNPSCKAKSTDPRTWGTYEQAIAVAERGNAAGVGFVLGGGWAGIDLDHCCDAAAGVIEPWAASIVVTMATYTEISPSGTGLHLLMQATMSDGERGRRRGPIEVYGTGRFFTVTGRHLTETPATAEERQEQLKRFLADYFPPRPTTRAQLQNTTDPLVIADLSDADLLALARARDAKFAALWDGDTAGYDGDLSRATAALCMKLAFWTRGNSTRMDALFRQSGLMRDKWDARRGDSTWGAREIDTAIALQTQCFSSPHLQEPVLAETSGHANSGTRARSAGIIAARLTASEQVEGQVSADRTEERRESNNKTSRGRGPSTASQLVTLAAGADLFHDVEGRTWVTIPVDAHWETWPLGSKAFKQWLGRRLYDTEHKTPSAQALQDALLVLDGCARFDGPTLTVSVRVAEHDSAIYLDLADKEWQAVKITETGWEVVSVANLPVKFRRSKGMLPLPVPACGSSLDALGRFVNLDSEDTGRADWVLLIAWLLGTLSPSGPYPVLALSGEQGSAKSTLARVLRALVDPNVAALRSEPKEVRDLVIAANNSWTIVLDNLSSMPQWLSDALCRLSTGGGFATRTLYENDEETIFNVQRPVILTGIEEVATRGDLVDRAIVLSLPTIPDERRQPESVFWREFDRARPAILGSLLDAVSEALRELSSVKLDKLPRMADFALWVTAAERACGWQPGTFMTAYTANRANVNDVVLEASLVAGVLMTLVKPGTSWKGTMGELHAELLLADPTLKHKQGWPTTPRGLAGAIKRLAPNLRASGFRIERERTGHARSRTYSITRGRLLPEDAGDQSTAPSARGEKACDNGHVARARMRTVADDTGGGERYRPLNSPQVKPEFMKDTGSADRAADGADGSIPSSSDWEEVTAWTSQ